MNREQILGVIQENVRKTVPEAEDVVLDETMRMTNVGADSLDIVEVVSRSMKDLKIKVPRNELMLADDLKELVDLFEEALSKKAESG
jgi:acyl carrier protein